MKYLKNNRGEFLQFIVVVSVIALIGCNVIPPFYKAFNKRQDTTITIYNGDDTITKY